MSKIAKSTFGEAVRALRKKKKEPLRVVAAAIEVDSTLLSKIERGERFPTDEQVNKLASYFSVSFDELKAQVIADKIVTEYGHEEVTLEAVKMVKERATAYLKENK